MCRASMKTPLQLSLAVALAVTGCASTDRLPDDGDGDGSGSDMTDPPPPPKMQIGGAYRLESTFDVVTNFPGDSGSFLNGLIEATDDPNDPASWLVDQILAQMEPGTLKDILQGAKPFVIDSLNEELTSLAPELFGTITEIGQRMEDVTKHLGVDEKLEVGIGGIDVSTVGTLTADGVQFTIAGTTTKYLFADHDIDNVVVTGVPITLDLESRFRIAQHTLPLPYGKIARLALDAAVIPAIDPTADSLQELLANAADCTSVGQAIQDALGFGGATFWASACIGGMGLVADEVYAQILDTNALLDLNISGEARAADTDGDYKIDRLGSGKWTGTMTYDAADGTLADTATFTGSRMPGF